MKTLPMDIRSVFRTAQYQLSHASVRTDGKRAHCVFWFGVASYHKFKFKAEKHKGVCPICGRELHRFRFVGDRNLLNFGAEGGKQKCGVIICTVLVGITSMFMYLLIE